MPKLDTPMNVYETKNKKHTKKKKIFTYIFMYTNIYIYIDMDGKKKKS